MTSDELFYKEFREMVNDRRVQMGTSMKFQINNLPVCKEAVIKDGIPKTSMVLIKGVKSVNGFSALDNTEAQLVNKSNIKKRVVNSDGSFRKLDNGKYKTTDVKIKSNCVAVLSNVNIKLQRYETTANGTKRAIKYKEGFDYVDYVETKHGRKYIYIIPKEFVYKMNMAALIITPNSHRVYYKGCKVVMQNGNSLYIYVIPFKRYNEMAGYRVLNVKSSVNFNSEVSALLKYWIKMGVIFDINMTSVERGVKGVKNLAMTNYVGTLSIDEYVKCNKSLAESNSDDEELVEY